LTLAAAAVNSSTISARDRVWAEPQHQPRQIELAGHRILHRDLEEDRHVLAQVDVLAAQDRVGVGHVGQHPGHRAAHQVRHRQVPSRRRAERLDVRQRRLHAQRHRPVHAGRRRIIPGPHRQLAKRRRVALALELEVPHPAIVPPTPAPARGVMPQPTRAVRTAPGFTRIGSVGDAAGPPRREATP
jgi:hypothetical protein